MKTKDFSSPDNQEEVSEQVSSQVSEQSSNPSAEKSWFDIVYDSVWGFICAIAQLIGGVLLFYCIYYGIKSGYECWFDTDDLVEVGECGYYYDFENDCFVKPMPNRRVLDGCVSLKCEDGDTIGIVLLRNGMYRYVDLNNLTFINDQSYEYANSFRNGVAIALSNDTIYHISTDGKILSSEPSTWIYGSVEEIDYLQKEIDCDGDAFTERIPTGVFMYEDVNGNYGLMSPDFVRLTPALYSDITAKSKDVFFCEYFGSKMGCLIDRNGNYLK